MAWCGYAGKSLVVDLSTARSCTEELDRSTVEEYVGGLGMALHLYFRSWAQESEALSPDNPVVISAGPFIGTPLPAASKITVLTRFPQNGAVNPGKAGGRFGPMLKYAGYDNMVLLGASPVPVYLRVDGDEVEIRRANDLWGLDVHAATDELWRRHGRDYSVVAIGPAGENLVNISLSFVDKLQTLGKGGLGAVFGSKKLKAICVRGTKGIAVKDKKFHQIVYSELRAMMADPMLRPWLELGSLFFYNSRFQWYYKNYSEMRPEREARRFGPEAFLSEVKRTPLACPSCPAGCKSFCEVLAPGEHAGRRFVVSTLGGRIAHFAHRCNVEDVQSALACTDLCNRLGLCAHNATILIDWASELFRKGIIKETDMGGIVPGSGSSSTAKLIEMMAKKEGFGAILAQGVEGAAETIGRGSSELAVHIKGMDINLDPRINRLGTLEFHEVVNPRGGHQQVALTEGGNIYIGDRDDDSLYRDWCRRVGLPADAVARIFKGGHGPNIARLTKWSEDWWHLVDSLGWGCYYHKRTYTMEKLIRAYALATGIDADERSFLTVGERSYNLLRAMNALLGFSRKDDRFPDRWFEPIIDEGRPRPMLDMNGRPITRQLAQRLLDDYYKERGWDAATGNPSSKKLAELGLELAANLVGSSRAQKG